MMAKGKLKALVEEKSLDDLPQIMVDQGAGKFLARVAFIPSTT